MSVSQFQRAQSGDTCFETCDKEGHNCGNPYWSKTAHVVGSKRRAAFMRKSLRSGSN